MSTERQILVLSKHAVVVSLSVATLFRSECTSMKNNNKSGIERVFATSTEPLDPWRTGLACNRFTVPLRQHDSQQELHATGCERSSVPHKQKGRNFILFIS
jgi:hypothetical protein